MRAAGGRAGVRPRGAYIFASSGTACRQVSVESGNFSSCDFAAVLALPTAAAKWRWRGERPAERKRRGERGAHVRARRV